MYSLNSCEKDLSLVVFALFLLCKAISGKEITVLESACSDEPLGLCSPSPFERSYHVPARLDACLPTVAQCIAKRRSPSGGIPAEGTETTRLCGRAGVETLRGQPLAGRHPFWLGTPDRGLGFGGATHWEPLSGGSSSLQGPQTLGRA